MTNRTVGILTCCVGLSWATFANAQSAATGTDEQQQELQALRKAEGGSVSEQIQAEQAAQSGITAPQQAPAAQPQTQPMQPAGATPTPAAAAPTPTPAPTVVLAPVTAPAPVPAGISDEQVKALQALRQSEGGSIAVAPGLNAAANTDLAKQQLIQAEDALSAAKHQARADQIAQEEAARELQMQDDAKIRRALDAEKAAEAALAEMAKQAAPAPAPAPVAAPSQPVAVAPAPLTKEEQLANLLRLYQADQITPYEYHMERAKIVAEP
jgi:hypothetical protein